MESILGAEEEDGLGVVVYPFTQSCRCNLKHRPVLQGMCQSWLYCALTFATKTPHRYDAD